MGVKKMKNPRLSTAANTFNLRRRVSACFLLPLDQEGVRTVWQLLFRTAPSPVHHSLHTGMELDLPSLLGNKVLSLKRLYFDTLLLLLFPYFGNPLRWLPLGA